MSVTAGSMSGSKTPRAFYVSEDIGIVASSLKRAPSKVDALLPVSLLILAPAGKP